MNNFKACHDEQSPESDNSASSAGTGGSIQNVPGAQQDSALLDAYSQAVIGVVSQVGPAVISISGPRLILPVRAKKSPTASDGAALAFASKSLNVHNRGVTLAAVAKGRELSSELPRGRYCVADPQIAKQEGTFWSDTNGEASWPGGWLPSILSS